MKNLTIILILTLLAACSSLELDRRSPVGVFINDTGYNQHAEIKIERDGHYIRTHSFTYGVPLSIDGEEHHGWTNYEIGTWSYENGTITLTPASQQLENETVGNERFGNSRSLQFALCDGKWALHYEDDGFAVFYKKK